MSPPIAATSRHTDSALAAGAPVPLHARQEVIDGLAQRFAYAFAQSEFYRPIVRGEALGEEARVGPMQARFVDQPHGTTSSLGLRFDEGGRSAGYAVDFHDMTADMKTMYQGLDLWICDCLRRTPHPTHAHLARTLEWIARARPKLAVLTNLHIDMDYQTLLRELPEGVVPAYDGMVLEF